MGRVFPGMADPEPPAELQILFREAPFPGGWKEGEGQQEEDLHGNARRARTVPFHSDSRAISRVSTRHHSLVSGCLGWAAGVKVPWTLKHHTQLTWSRSDL